MDAIGSDNSPPLESDSHMATDFAHIDPQPGLFGSSNELAATNMPNQQLVASAAVQMHISAGNVLSAPNEGADQPPLDAWAPLPIEVCSIPRLCQKLASLSLTRPAYALMTGSNCLV